VLADIDWLIEMQGPEDDAGGSFWQETGRNHRDMVARYGFESFKRHLNWQYGGFAQAGKWALPRIESGAGFSGSRS
jgi:hypothetical protein